MVKSRDLETIELHLLEPGHIALEGDGEGIADHSRRQRTPEIEP